MENRIAISDYEKVFWNCGLDVTTGGSLYSLKRSWRWRLVSPKYCKFYTKVASNHVDNIESIASNVKFDFLGFTRRVE